ncbi:MAG: tyrosine-type recombinase/integrase [Hyphomicrobiales bacterium]
MSKSKFGLRKRGKSPYYSFEFQYNKVAYRGSTGCERKSDAFSHTNQLRTQIIEQVKLQVARNSKQLSVLTLDDALARYYDEKGQHAADPKQKQTDLARIKKYLAASKQGADTLLVNIDDADLAAFIAIRRGQQTKLKKLPSNRTVNLQTTILLREIFTHAKTKWNIQIKHEPNWNAHKLKQHKKPIREISPEEETIYFQHLREDYRPIVKFLSLTGVRRMNSILKWENINFQTKLITFISKNQKVHNIPITREIEILLLAEHGNHSEFVFTYISTRAKKGIRERGKRYPIVVDGLRFQTDRASKSSKIKITRHNWRHTVGSRVTRTSGIIMAQKLLGHSSIKTTEAHYAHVDNDDILTAMENASEWAKDKQKQVKKQSV